MPRRNFWLKYKITIVHATILISKLDFAGSPCVLAIFFFSPLVSYGVMATLFPLVQFNTHFTLNNFLCDLFFPVLNLLIDLTTMTGAFQFVLTATASGAEEVLSSRRRKWRGAGLWRLPIFYLADTLS